MAKIGKGILGGINGSIANLTGYRRGLDDVIQGKMSNHVSRNSQLQLTQQSRFAELVKFMKFLISEFGYIPFVSNDKRLNAFNYGEKINASSFDANGIVNVDNLLFSTGKLYSSYLTYCSFSTATNSFTTAYYPVCSGEFCNSQDIAYQYAVNLTQGTYGRIPGIVYRNAGRGAGISPLSYNPGDEMYLFMSFVSHPDYNYAANSIMRKAVVI